MPKPGSTLVFNFCFLKGRNESLSNCLNPHLLISSFPSEVAAFAISFVSSNGRQTLLAVAGRELQTWDLFSMIGL